MIKFFRNIRKNLLNEGETSKYLKYALGEIVLVVIGILIALQLNDWNDKRKHKANEKLYLENLYIDVQDMDSIYEWKLEKSHKRLKTALDGLEYIKYCGKSSNKIDLDSTLLTHQGLISLSIIDDTYNEMLSSNIISGLSNSQLKSSITNFFAEIKSSNEFIKYFRTDLGRASDIIWKYVSFEYDSTKKLTVNYNLVDICEVSEFKNALVEVIDSREDFVMLIKELKLLIENLESELKNELKK